jgi:hypothetical protein
LSRFVGELGVEDERLLQQQLDESSGSGQAGGGESS